MPGPERVGRSSQQGEQCRSVEVELRDLTSPPPGALARRGQVVIARSGIGDMRYRATGRPPNQSRTIQMARSGPPPGSGTCARPMVRAPRKSTTVKAIAIPTGLSRGDDLPVLWTPWPGRKSPSARVPSHLLIPAIHPRPREPRGRCECDRELERGEDTDDVRLDRGDGSWQTGWRRRRSWGVGRSRGLLQGSMRSRWVHPVHPRSRSSSSSLGAAGTELRKTESSSSTSSSSSAKDAES